MNLCHFSSSMRKCSLPTFDGSTSSCARGGTLGPAQRAHGHRHARRHWRARHLHEVPLDVIVLRRLRQVEPLERQDAADPLRGRAVGVVVEAHLGREAQVLAHHARHVAQRELRARTRGCGPGGAAGGQEQRAPRGSSSLRRWRARSATRPGRPRACRGSGARSAPRRTRSGASGSSPTES